MRKHLITAAITLAFGFAGHAFAADAMPKDAYKAEKDKIEEQAKADKKACDAMKENAKDICQAEAKAKEKVAKAELDAKNKPSPKADQKVSLMKAGLIYSDFLNTVSPTYAREIQTPEFGLGLDGLLRARSHVLTGILNGVDYSEWSPENDPHIAAPYSASDLSGKSICKQDLLREFGLPPEAMKRSPWL